MLSLGAAYLIGSIKLTRRGKLHAAEHKAVNAYYNKEKLVPEKLKQESAASLRCGSNLVITFYLGTFLFYLGGFEYFWFLGLLFAEPLAIAIKTSHNDLTKKIIEKTQELFFVSSPEDRELEMASSALQELIESEKELEKELIN